MTTANIRPTIGQISAKTGKKDAIEHIRKHRNTKKNVPAGEAGTSCVSESELLSDVNNLAVNNVEAVLNSINTLAVEVVDC